MKSISDSDFSLLVEKLPVALRLADGAVGGDIAGINALRRLRNLHGKMKRQQQKPLKIREMTKNDFAKALCLETGIGHEEALKVMDVITVAMAGAFRRGENIYLRGFGTYEIVRRKAKKARNISTGECVMVPETVTVKFRPCRDLKKDMNDRG